jgi:hypothetical protein
MQTLPSAHMRACVCCIYRPESRIHKTPSDARADSDSESNRVSKPRRNEWWQRYSDGACHGCSEALCRHCAVGASRNFFAGEEKPWSTWGERTEL